MKKGKLIVLEGIDGCGKSTQIARLKAYLEERGEQVVLTAEPTEHGEGKLLRRALSGEISSTAAGLAALFTADRIVHNTDPENGIARLVEEGKTVLCDRYYYSTLAYQAPLTDTEWVWGMCLCCPEIRVPDLCIFLDLDPGESMRRIRAGRTSTEIYETEEQQERIRDGFLAVFDRMRAQNRGENIRVVSALGTPEEVSARVFEAVSSVL